MSIEDPHRRALHEILVTRAIDWREADENEIRIELQRAGIVSPTDADILKVVDARRRGDLERDAERHNSRPDT